MGLLDFIRPGTGTHSHPAQGEEHIFAVPLLAAKRPGTGARTQETYIFYAFLFAKSAEAAVMRIQRELKDEGLEFIELTGKVLQTSVPEWTDFVLHNFEWIKDLLPTARQIGEGARSMVYYTPKITKY